MGIFHLIAGPCNLLSPPQPVVGGRHGLAVGQLAEDGLTFDVVSVLGDPPVFAEGLQAVVGVVGAGDQPVGAAVLGGEPVTD